jgi:hypothetical protein
MSTAAGYRQAVLDMEPYTELILTIRTAPGLLEIQFNHHTAHRRREGVPRCGRQRSVREERYSQYALLQCSTAAAVFHIRLDDLRVTINGPPLG